LHHNTPFGACVDEGLTVSGGRSQMIFAKGVRLKKNLFWLVGFSAAILLTTGTLLNIRLGRDAREEVRHQFNDEQLMIARGIKYWIERQIGFLGKELLLVSKSVENSAMPPPELHLVLQPCFERVLELGVAKIVLHDTKRRLKHTFFAYQKTVKTTADDALMDWIPSSQGRDTVAFSRPSGSGPEMHMTLSTVLDHPVFDRISFHLNPSWFLTPYLQSIRSGKSGYAWVIDADGIFLYHPQPAFIGQSAFEARRGREPDISHHLIDTIQRENMLKGKEGNGYYHSGWHRGVTGKIEKLIAFSPVTISEAPYQFWSVAVVAPVFEIEEALRIIHRRQGLLQSFVILLIVIAGGAVLFFEIRWSNRLEKTVEARTLALKRSEENYRSLVESAEDFIFTLDQNGRLLSVNSFTAAWFGNRPEELIGQGVESLFPEEVAERLLEILQRVFETSKSIRYEFAPAQDSSETWISANFMPLKYEGGCMTAVLCIARDITENKKLERQLINTEKLASLGTLAAGVAHEINNPLGVMLGFCDLLVRKKDPSSQEYEDLKIIERQGLHCKQVVENLLSFARVGRETSTDTDLNTCLQDIIKVVHHSLEMKNVELRVELAENLPRVTGDDRQLQQVFLNLINNAAAAMPEGGLLTIWTNRAGGGKKVEVLIRDQGTGIPAEIMDHIFEPFYTTKPEGEGTGLGLFVSYGIINKYGGTILCESHTQGTADAPRGTDFRVVLPASMEEYKWLAESLS
jgi:two-component system, NtrC family, sensor kinase